MMTQSLYEQLQDAKTEEDVKDIYIKALGLTAYSKNLIDIQTKEIWFEAKGVPTSAYKMFTQLLHYVQVSDNNGEHIPPILCVIDTEKAAILKTADILPFLKKKTIKWGKSASNVSKEALDEVSTFIGAYIIHYNIRDNGNEFIDVIKSAIKNPNEIIRRQITPDNLKQVFDKWVDMIGREIQGVPTDKYDLLFYADIMHDGIKFVNDKLNAKVTIDQTGEPTFLLDGNYYEIGSKKGYENFWKIYHRPPNPEYHKELLERRDSLIPIVERKRKGGYYTPLHIADKAYDTLSDILGKNWQKNYIIWDMCCGTGNLEVKHSNHRNIFMSTLDRADIDIMQAARTCASAVKFQYDYLNDDIDDFGRIDYTITNKVPQELREAIASGKKILVLMNPPYAEATNAHNTANQGVSGDMKTGVAKTQLSTIVMKQYGKASNELFTQFLARIALEIPTATIAMFSKLKYVNAPNFEIFRQNWNAKYLGGFITHSKAFESLTGNFPIGFLIWQTNNLAKRKTVLKDITVEVIDKNAKPIGEKKFYNLPKKSFLNVWLKRPKANKIPVIPLKNAVSPFITIPRVKTWHDKAIAYMYCGVNDLQHTTQQTVIFSSVYGGGNGFYITPENLSQSSVIFAVRRLIKPTWINDRDQFLQPNRELSSEFKNDCLIYMLFSGSNLTASANDLEWDNQKWSIVNHFIPFSENEVGSNQRFESDFMVKYLQKLTLSTQAKFVLNAGQKLWQAYFKHRYSNDIRTELKLNRPDVGWYQIRKALEKCNEQGDDIPVDFAEFKQSYDELCDKLRPLVYEYGFLMD